MFDPRNPYNNLPDLPPAQDLETTAILKLAISAHRALAELKGRGDLLPNQRILVGALTIQEAQLSSEIEGIVTTTDRLFRALSETSDAEDDAHSKEVLLYRDALWHGVNRMRAGRPLSTVLFEELVQIIKQNRAGVRKGSGTALQDQRTLQIVYTPPEGEELIRRKLANLEQFIHSSSDIDPLVRLAVIHYQFEAIHPFADGNGRVGRILNILFLLQQDLLIEPVLYLSRYIIQHKAEYYRLLRGVTEDSDWNAWIRFVLEAVQQTSDSTLKQIEQIRSLMNDYSGRVKHELPRMHSKDLIEILFERPYCKARFLVDAGIAKRQTAAKYLQSLADAGFMRPIRIGKEMVYVNAEFVDLLSAAHVDDIDTTAERVD
jgi:Fic family protein